MSPRKNFGEPWEVFEMVRGQPAQVPAWLMMAMGGDRQPMNEPQKGLLESLGRSLRRLRENPSRCQDGS